MGRIKVEELVFEDFLFLPFFTMMRPKVSFLTLLKKQYLKTILKIFLMNNILNDLKNKCH